MPDTAPLYFRPRLNMLAPANAAATAAMTGVEGIVTVKISGGKRNQRRRGLFWIVAGLVTELLNDAHGLALTENELHDITRTKLGMYDEVTLPSGDIHRRLHSTADKAMSEADRTVYTDKAFALWSRWCGVPVGTLTDEAERA